MSQRQSFLGLIVNVIGSPSIHLKLPLQRDPHMLAGFPENFRKCGAASQTVKTAAPP